MKTLFIHITVCLIMMTLHSRPSDARQMRNIFSITDIDYENIGKSTVYENTILTEVLKGFSFTLKGYHDKRSTWDNTIITIGPVININRYHYMEINYGYVQDSAKRRADYY